MAKGPSVVIIARHGARLDVEDSKWQSTSATPYDTPLTYGGWTQSRALGARIASLLHARNLAAIRTEAEKSPKSTDPGNASRGPQDVTATSPNSSSRKVFIHSSPFLRCVQTSIAIAAGMAQYQGNIIKFREPASPSIPATPRLFTAPERLKTTDAKDEKGQIIPKQEEYKVSGTQLPIPSNISFTKPLIRIDAFLGEWLSPDYYEFIVAPPPSDVMVANAKAELSSSAEQIQGAQYSTNSELNANLTENKAINENTTLSVVDIKEALPDLPNLPQDDSKIKNTTRISVERSNNQSVSDVGYTPPTPNYALSTSEPIPKGYVAHARNSCVNVDFKWDSMENPQNWGDGGEYGEEWSSMHKRFRKGISEMISWYKQQEFSILESNSEADGVSHENSNNSTDTILIIVTHGAGCNALIGALTSQPVLMDIGMGSLTMAVRRDKLTSTPDDKLFRVISGRRKSSTIDPILTQEYEMKLIASTDHLRAGADPLKIPQLQSPRMLPSISEHQRDLSGRRSSAIVLPVSPSNEYASSKNSALGSIRRSTVTSTAAYRSNTSTSLSSRPTLSPNSTGLWGSPSMSPAKKDSLPALEEIPKLSGGSLDEISAEVEKGEGKWTTIPSQTIERSSTQHGLWGSRPPMERNPSKRRWTFNEH